MNTKKIISTPVPWYRVAMVWLMIALPLIVVVASLTTAVIAQKHAPVLLNQSTHR